jgi:hypothetical protein
MVRSHAGDLRPITGELSSKLASVPENHHMSYILVDLHGEILEARVAQDTVWVRGQVTSSELIDSSQELLDGLEDRR